jgi:hypothetical protein
MIALTKLIPSSAPISAVGPLALGISEPNVDQRHVGIFFRTNDSNEHQFIHLAFHHLLKVEQAADQNCFWVVPEVPDRRLRQVAAICRQIANAKPDIPYSFGTPSDCFDRETAEFLLGPTTTGLTCASFVLAVFQQAGIPLVVCETWPPPNPEDIQWQEHIVGWLESNRVRYGVSDAHLQSIRNEVSTSVRYRPEHVAAVGMLRNRKPLRYLPTLRFSKMILAQIRGKSVKPHLTLAEILLCSVVKVSKRYTIVKP